MKAYGLRKKISRNIPDVHPKKGYTMWWKVDWFSAEKKRERQRGKKEINKQLND